MIDLTISAKGLNDIDRYLGRLGNQANKIMARAANSAMSNTSKNMKKEVSARYHIASKEVGKTIRKQKASPSKPSARIVSRGRRPNLAKFKVSPLRRYKIKKSGGRDPDVYKYSIKKGSVLKAFDSSPKPFVVNYNCSPKVFQRKTEDEISTMTGKKRNRKDLRGKSPNNINALYGPSVPQMLKKEEILEKITQEANQMMQKRMAHEIERILG